jgi:hypothetical protein
MRSRQSREATGLELTQAEAVVPQCSYTLSEPTYAVQSVNTQFQHASPAFASASVANATSIAGFPAGSQAYEQSAAGDEQTVVYFPKLQVLATCWTIGTDSKVDVSSAKAFCRWFATDGNLANRLP